ncbi:hypothetical protein F5X99DRAFT_311842 [Biscogniauxia marginata]|nr:hypothetical protein F5X99DRAFT_311842 [Biscogniauxia marginata]
MGTTRHLYVVPGLPVFLTLPRVCPGRANSKGPRTAKRRLAQTSTVPSLPGSPSASVDVIQTSQLVGSVSILACAMQPLSFFSSLCLSLSVDFASLYPEMPNHLT